uniref:Uncharacterized protein n=1 Tax=Anguilla anguilla TaxID=7936 RepID=A0A0E9T2A3_ANGAN
MHWSNCAYIRTEIACAGRPCGAQRIQVLQLLYNMVNPTQQVAILAKAQLAQERRR